MGEGGGRRKAQRVFDAYQGRSCYGCLKVLGFFFRVCYFSQCVLPWAHVWAKNPIRVFHK